MSVKLEELASAVRQDGTVFQVVKDGVARQLEIAAAGTVLSGAGAPSGGTGIDGDFYLDTSASRIFGPKTSGSWGEGAWLVPQSLGTADSPAFAGLTISGLAPSRLVATNGSKDLASTVSLASLVASVSDVTGSTGTANSNLVLSAGPTLTGTVTASAVTMSGVLTNSNASSTALTLSGNDAGIRFSSGTGTKTISTGGSTHLNLAPGGGVGIGTADPSSYGKLAVQQAADTNSSGIATVNTSTQSARLYVDASGVRHLTAGTTDVINWDNSGNVGIGTSDPGSKLEVINAASGEAGAFHANSIFRLHNSTNLFIETRVPQNSYSGLLFTDNTSQAGGIVYAHNSTSQNNQLAMGAWQTISFHTEGVSGVFEKSERMRIDASGDVGIGTSNPGAKLDVNGTFEVSGAATLQSSLSVGSSGQFQVDSSGAVATSGTVTLPGLSASSLVSTDGSSQLTAGISLANLVDSISGVSGSTGSIDLVLSNSPTLSGIVAGNLTWSGSQTLQSTLTVNGLSGTGTRLVTATSGGQLGNAITIAGNNTFTGTMAVQSTFSVGSGSPFQVNSSGAVTAATGITTTGGIAVTGNSTISGTLGSLMGLSSSGTITFSGLNGTGTRLVTATSSGQLGNATEISGSYTFDGAMTLENDLEVQQDADVLGNLFVGGAGYDRILSVQADGSGYGPEVTVGSGEEDAILRVHGDAGVTGNLDVAGSVTLQSLTVSDLAANRLVATGSSGELGSSIPVDNLRSSVTGTQGTGSLVFATSPSVTSLTVSSGGVAVTGNSTINGTLSLLTGLSSSGTVTFSGLNGTGTRLVTVTSSGQLGNATTIAGNLTWSGMQTLQSTLTVNGLSGTGTRLVTATSGGQLGNATIIAGNNTFTGTMAVQSTFSAGSGGQFQVDSSGAVAAATGITTTGGIAVTGNSTINGTLGSLMGLNSSGTVTFSGLNGTGTRLVTATSSGQLGNATEISGSYTFDGAMMLENDLEVQQDADVLGNLFVGGSGYDRILSVQADGSGYGPEVTVGSEEEDAILRVHGGVIAEASGYEDKALETGVGRVLFGDKVFLAPATESRASLNIAPGDAPIYPEDGDIWVEGGTAYIQLDGTTVPFADIYSY